MRIEFTLRGHAQSKASSRRIVTIDSQQRSIKNKRGWHLKRLQ
jgi:hypothetical protein